MITIHPYLSTYKESCLEIFKSNMPQYFLANELEDFSQWLDDKALDGRYYIGMHDNSVVACGGYFYDPKKQKAGLSWGMVHANLHGTGIGSLLTTYRIQKMMQEFPHSIHMMDTSQHTYQFYQKFGFVVRKIIPNGFGNGMDQYYMERPASS